jgi:hypothetical protein
MKNNTKWRCTECGAITKDSNILRAPSPFNSTEILFGCPYCFMSTDFEISTGFDILCDEPDCTNIASCGWPTGNKDDDWGGYRYSCLQHSKIDN